MNEIKNGLITFKNYQQKYISDGKPRIELYQADCMDLMKEIPDKYYELCVVDPPYGIFGGGRSQITSTGLKKK